MWKAILPIVLSIGLGTTAWARTEGELAQGMVNLGYQETPDWFKVSFLDLPEDLAEAVESGRRLALYFYQDGCPYCKKLIEENFGQPQIADYARAHFDFIAIDLWGDRELTDFSGDSRSEKAFASDLRVMFTPTLLFFDEQGKLALRLNGYRPPQAFLLALEYASQPRTENLRQFTARHAAAAADTAPGETAPAAVQLDARRSKKPLLVVFERRACAPCDELNRDIFRREPTRRLLDAFDVVHLDADAQTPVRTPQGQATTAREYADALGVDYWPTLIFFGPDGNEVFRIEAYLKAFHIQSALDYVASGSYRSEPEFQRYIEARADRLRQQGIEVRLME